MKRVLGVGIVLLAFAPLVLPSAFGHENFGAQVKNAPVAVEGYLIASPSGSFGNAPVGSLEGGILVPGIHVWLRNLSMNTRTLTVRTDLSGRFTFPPRQRPGRYAVCWKEFGFVPGCSKAFAVSGQHLHLHSIRIQIARTHTTRSFYGSVLFADGSLTHTFEPVSNASSFAMVRALTAARIPRAYVNRYGEYLLPRVPVIVRKVKLRASIEATAKTLVAGAPIGPARRVDFKLGNKPPVVEGVVATAPGGEHWTAAPGDTLTLNAKGRDPDGDPLKYRWTLPDGSSILDSAGGATVTYNVPNRPGTYQFDVLAYDGKGGYAKDSVKVSTQGVRFAGTVGATNAPAVSGVLVSVNGTTTTTDATGAFSLLVAESPRYVLNLKKQGYGLVSRIYDNGIVGGRWTLTRASVATVDPTQPIDITNKRTRTDCLGSLNDQAKRRGKPPDQCGPGIRVQIPADSLVDAGGNPPPGPVDVELSTVDLSAPDAMPGDYTALDSGGAQFVMESAGAGTIEISRGGTRYNLAPGAAAIVSIPIDPSQLGAVVPPTIPLLSYDESRGLWIQEGTATLSGSRYVGKVSHFSAINTDQLKVNQACFRIDATSMPASFNLELDIPTSGGGTVTKSGAIVNDPQRFHVAYNLPTGQNVKLRAYDTTGASPTAITFVQLPPANPPVSTTELTVNTGGPQSPTTPNLPAFPYAACQVTVELVPFTLPPAVQAEFLNGLSFSAPDINFASASDAGLITTGAQNYYDTIDPNHLRLDLTDFKTINGFGSGSGSEDHAFYANSGDLGFGRDMHCHKTGADVACYVSNYGNRFTDDVQDFKDAVDDNGQIATVGMEYSQVENPVGAGFQAKTGGGVLRIVKFYVFAHAVPTTNPAHPGQGDGRVVSADLDGFGQRPVPALCMVCHGGRFNVATSGPGVPAWTTSNANTADLTSKFIPFDIREYTFTPTPYNSHDKTSESPHFTSLNQNFVLATTPPTATIDAIAAFYAAGPTQDENALVCGWRDVSVTGCTATSVVANQAQTYQKVVASTCRSCHLSQAPSTIDWTTAQKYKNAAGLIGYAVCTGHYMPHAKVTHNLFWLSTSPPLPPILKTFLNSASAGAGANCGP